MTQNSNILKTKDVLKSAQAHISYLITKIRVIAFVSVLGGVLGVLIAIFSNTTYKAFSSFSLDEDKGSGGLAGYIGVASQLGIDLGNSGGSVFTGENIIELLKSRRVVESALLVRMNNDKGAVTLADYYLDAFKFREQLEKVGLQKIAFKDIARVNFTRDQDSVLGLMYKSLVKNNIAINKVDKKLSIYHLEVVSTDEVFSKLFSEALLDEVTRFYIETKTKKARATVNLLERKVDSVKTTYEASLLSGASFNDANRNIIKQIASTNSVKRQLEIQMLATYYAELVKHLETAKLSLARETPYIQKVDTPTYPLEKKKFGKLKGIVLGTFVSFILVCMFFSLRLTFKRLVNDDTV
jgi:hypothetical protein